MTNTQGTRRWAALMSAPILMTVATAVVLPAQTFSTLHRLDSIDGDQPRTGLLEAADGNLYGTTIAGGAYGFGTIFKITASGAVKTIYSFCSQSGCADGGSPYAGLVQASNGNIYGTTGSGGANSDGTIFEITPGGTLTTIHSFCSQSGCPDGEYPSGGALVEGRDRDLYGTAYYGGAHGSGTVYKITLSGTLTTVHSFDGSDGSIPLGGLVLASDGNFYGTTDEGGVYLSGTVFKITPGGVLTTLHYFHGGDGDEPSVALVQASDGNLYGVTYRGGTSGLGTLFRITPSGVLTTLYDFCSHHACTDGDEPEAALLQADDGNLYGTTAFGGMKNEGTVFRVTLTGALTTLYSFCSEKDCADGENPEGALIQDTNGNLYGTTLLGGDESACTEGCGTLFGLFLGSGPPVVETQPTSQGNRDSRN